MLRWHVIDGLLTHVYAKRCIGFNAILKTFTYLASSTLLHNKDIIHNQQEIVEDMQGDLIKKNVQKVGPRSSLIFRF